MNACYPAKSWLSGKRMGARWLLAGSCCLALLVGGGASVATQRAQTQTDLKDTESPVPFDRGQPVVPVFEGWYRDASGVLHLSWGFLNRNFKEELRVPIGPDNHFEPGQPDQGQPTYFLPRRQWGAFAVVVPQDLEKKLAAEKKAITWTLRSHGQTTSVPANTGPAYAVDALVEPTVGNTPPFVRFEAPAMVRPGQGPGGVRATFKATVGKPLTIDVWVADDGVTPPHREYRGVTLTWMPYRGAGGVTIAPAGPKIDAAGKASVAATFSQPGDYTLRVEAIDINTHDFQCCWTNGYAAVSVSEAR